MDIAVLSDIHGNYIALQRVLEYATSHDIKTFIFLGDYIGELAYPEKTMQILYEMNEKYQCYFIKGNKEDYWLNYRNDGENGWEYRNSASGSLIYAYELLTLKDLDFFKQLPLVQVIEENQIMICHGSPYKVNEKMLPNHNRTFEIMDNIGTPLILCGHTHIQGKIVHHNKCVLNPGAVGMPLYSQGKTQFLILHGYHGRWNEEFISLEYDVDRVIKELHEAKLNEHAPYWSMVTEHVLRGGINSHSKVLKRAMELCKEKTGACVWPNIAEEYWKQAVTELIG